MKKLHLFILIIICFFLLTCKKYEEGPLISFRNPEKVIKGDWTVNKFYVNGNDSSNIFNEKNSTNIFNIKDCFFKFSDNSDDSYMTIFYDSTQLFGSYSILRKQKILNVSRFKSWPDSSFKIIGPFSSGVLSSWNITRLKTNEIWLKFNYLDTLYELHLERY